eukprot:TRINITY_DN1106_c0_g1_i9.p1 TRINITY_DN1106_c0_g1~~TRINITY_DN1106_c0_g1_i9.p1  ORF type:complete len:505 (-),score=83.51 TRINITY_DN1106_c0_g1_i9:67-1581(-)
MPFMGLTPTMLCKDSEESEFVECDMATACNSKIRKADINKSIVNWLVSFDLYCDSENTFWLYENLFFVGFFLGCLIVVPISDFFGRKFMILFSSIVISLAYLKLIFTKGAVTWAVVLLVSGAFVSLYYVTVLAYLSEVILQNTAVFYIAGIHLGFPISGFVSTILLQNSPNWKTPATLMSVIPLLIIAYFAYVVESPRYLAMRRSYKDARAATNLICAKNSVNPKRWMFDTESIVYNKGFVEVDKERQESYYQTPYLLRNHSGFLYFAAFGVLLLFSCFSICETLLEVKEFSDMFTTYMVEYAVMFGIILFLGFPFTVFGYKFSLLILLVATAMISGIRLFQFGDLLATLLLWANKLCALWSVIGAVSFSTLSCPVRVRATGLGLVLGLGSLGFIFGAIVLKFLSAHKWLFAVAPIVSLAGLKFTSEPWNYKTNDDVYELVEEAKKNFSHYISGPGGESAKQDPSYYMGEKKEETSKEGMKRESESDLRIPDYKQECHSENSCQ